MSFSEKKKQKSNHLAFVVTIIFSYFIGTYLDLLFVSKQMYTFPVRPFPDIFTINVAFTLLILPIFTALFLRIAKTLSAFSRILFIVLIGLCASVSEQFAENLGWFTHSEAWHHSYSFFGYMIFMLLIWKIYRWFQ
ncbi:CBO0543 family protein [Bacillus sp. DX1.1]|uniref:CBO0543 family protein n=1 Tax=unclassified Bacillus (in: firmicutes) TaxID=185979 RepID=UPI00256FAF90|nr:MULTISPECIES: CBO0543 family protein [unclassified Bacillus (in: firmicutes)]MDM5155706.1 CBO0543 family protein [Bacillus sp. DX1.1]WJE80008.1 CBO0543 family protein [Bacillus sp. DX3.1]